MVSRVVTLTLRGLEFIFTLLVMALVGNMIASAYAGNPSSVNYDMFVAVFSMLSLFYLIAVSFNDSYTGHAVIPITLDALNVLFFFTSAVAMAALLGAHSCSNTAYTLSNEITNGSSDTHGRCREAQATTAFLWFGWACYTASLVFSFMSSRGSANLRVPGIRRGGPSMSQV